MFHDAPRSLNNDLLDDGVILDMYNRVVDVAVAFGFPSHADTGAKIFPLEGSETDVGDMDEWMGLESEVEKNGWKT